MSLNRMAARRRSLTLLLIGLGRPGAESKGLPACESARNSGISPTWAGRCAPVLFRNLRQQRDAARACMLRPGDGKRCELSSVQEGVKGAKPRRVAGAEFLHCETL